ncbi:MAG: hypothetical protein Q7S09_02105 [bacterium]|nr:hypothetical protein [bacterium]
MPNISHASLSIDFIRSQQKLFLNHPTQYCEKIFTTVCDSEGSGRVTGIVYLLLNRHYGDPASLGFLLILGFLDRFNAQNGNPKWLTTCCEEMNRQENRSTVREYAIFFITNPGLEMEKLQESIGNLPIKTLIQDGEARWGQQFTVGAYCALGILLASNNESIQ